MLTRFFRLIIGGPPEFCLRCQMYGSPGDNYCSACGIPLTAPPRPTRCGNVNCRRKLSFYEQYCPECAFPNPNYHRRKAEAA